MMGSKEEGELDRRMRRGGAQIALHKSDIVINKQTTTMKSTKSKAQDTVLYVVVS